MRKKPKSYRLPGWMIEGTERRAEAYDVRPSEIVRRALEEFFERHPTAPQGAPVGRGEGEESREGGTPSLADPHRASAACG